MTEKEKRYIGNLIYSYNDHARLCREIAGYSRNKKDEHEVYAVYLAKADVCDKIVSDLEKFLKKMENNND